ncbi:hypothetical protein ONZ45_g19338 [Pleurotus djamor]|nr:hypothetical protein ONZ45_g19338 [Pleurotus djamor]
MLVDNSLVPPYAAPYDLSDFFHTDFLSSSAPTNNNASSSSTSTMPIDSTSVSHPSSPSSPASALNTPPQPQSPTSFPDILEPSPFVTHPYANLPLSNNSPPNDAGVFSFIDEEGKVLRGSADAESSFDLYNSYALGMGMSMDFSSMGLDLNNIGTDLH